MKKATHLTAFTSALACLPGVRVCEDPPARSGGSWFLDVDFRGRRVTVQWQARKGFGLSGPEEAVYGEGPHEVYPDPEAAARRTAELLLS